jgi:hypothetical protein
MSQAQSVTATFIRQVSLTVAAAGTGGGTVTGPGGISCPGVCSATFDAGTPIALSASADATSTFSGWSGACSGAACSFTLNSSSTATATFTRIRYALTVTVGGNGGGTVTSVPAGIVCSTGTCSALFDAGTPVSLVATPDATSTFGGWSGACAGAGACSVTLNGPVSVGASFDVTIAGLSATVSLLGKVIGSGPAASLNDKLSSAQASVARGNRTAAANQLNAFINEVEALIKSGRLDLATGNALIAEARMLIGLL